MNIFDTMFDECAAEQQKESEEQTLNSKGESDTGAEELEQSQNFGRSNRKEIASEERIKIDSMRNTSEPSNHHGEELGPYDVLCGRDKLAFSNIGNRRMRVFIELHLREYLDASSRGQKSYIIKKVVNTVRKCGGRFLKWSDQAHGYAEIGDKKAHEKCSHAFRDMVTSRQSPLSGKVGIARSRHNMKQFRSLSMPSVINLEDQEPPAPRPIRRSMSDECKTVETSSQRLMIPLPSELMCYGARGDELLQTNNEQNFTTSVQEPVGKLPFDVEQRICFPPEVSANQASSVSTDGHASFDVKEQIHSEETETETELSNVFDTEDDQKLFLDLINSVE